MVHKFISNDNKGNVNVFEVGSTYTKLGKVADPVEPNDVATKAYVDEHSGGGSNSSSGGLVCRISEVTDPEADIPEGYQEFVMDHTAAEIVAAYPFVAIIHDEYERTNDGHVEIGSYTGRINACNHHIYTYEDEETGSEYEEHEWNFDVSSFSVVGFLGTFVATSEDAYPTMLKQITSPK